VPQVWALLALAVLWASLDRSLGRTDGRWYGLLTLMAALQQLFDGAAGIRRADDRAFVGPWACALWGSIGVTFAYAMRLWRVEGNREDTRLIRSGLWVVAGAMALFGVTGELRRFFELQTLSSETASLASGLAVSAWWLLYAAALVGVGFSLTLQPARVAGLAVAGLAVLKVVFRPLRPRRLVSCRLGVSARAGGAFAGLPLLPLRPQRARMTHHRTPLMHTPELLTA
jgi:hypothetical protein